jgi:hypothetical protein
MRKRKRYRCEGITKKGNRCKNLSVGLRCHLHPERVPKKTALENIGTAVRVTTGGASAIKLIYEILKFLIAHWPEINRFFHGLDTNAYFGYWQNYRNACSQALREEVISEQEAHDLVIEFNNWFPTLPRPVRSMVLVKFGERTLRKITREGTS